MASADKTGIILCSVRDDLMKDEKSKTNQNILSMEEYKAGQENLRATATGDVAQAPFEESKPGKILPFKKRKKENALQTQGKSFEGRIIYMANYLKERSERRLDELSGSYPPPPFFANEGSAEGKIIMMKDHRKNSEETKSEPWKSAPGAVSFSRASGYMAVASVAVMAFALSFFIKTKGHFDEGSSRGLASSPAQEKTIHNGREPTAEELLGGEARRSPQSLSLKPSSLLLVNQKSIVPGRRPTPKEQMNGY